MSSLILAIVGGGTALAIITYLVYLIRQGATDHASVGSLDAQTKLAQAKVKTLDDQIVDAEYRRRVEEKKRNAATAKTTTAADAVGVLKNAFGDKPDNLN